MAKGRRARRERITIQSVGAGTGDYGQPLKIWSDIRELVNIPAGYDVVGGTETFRGNQVQADVVAVFSIREQPTPITPMNRLVHNEKVYGISAVRPSNGPFENGHRDTLIFVKAIANNG